MTLDDAMPARHAELLDRAYYDRCAEDINRIAGNLEAKGHPDYIVDQYRREQFGFLRGVLDQERMIAYEEAGGMWSETFAAMSADPDRRIPDQDRGGYDRRLWSVDGDVTR